MSVYRELVAVSVPVRRAAALTGVSRASASYRPRSATGAAGESVRPVPVNKLTADERQQVLGVLDSDRFIDLAPLQIYGRLLDTGVYMCSVSTFYRVLKENRQVKERRRLATHPPRVRPELVATGPGQVYSWDITKLAGPVKGRYYDTYVMIDIYSRYIVGVSVQAHESGLLAQEMMEQAFGIHGIPHVVHADRGTSMTSKTVATLLADLHVTRSHSRPKVSNDNPYSEAWFKTLKYAPVFPERFGSLYDARAFINEFVEYYNHEHLHTGIGLNTPANVHFGIAENTSTQRSEILAAARAANPERFTTQEIMPKILNLPQHAWINKPNDEIEKENAA